MKKNCYYSSMWEEIFKEWQRLEFNEVPIYVNPEKPDWFVPNNTADQVLQQLAKGKEVKKTSEIHQLLTRIQENGKSIDTYKGRTPHLKLDRLRECWLHITNNCNQNCSHCMFNSSPLAGQELNRNDVLKVIREAQTLGCRIFYFTGGEPFVSDALYPALHTIFNETDTHAVILTNLTLIRQHIDHLSGFPKERLHFQVSIDGIGENHDQLRGKGAFNKLIDNLKTLIEAGFPCTLAMAVNRHNVPDMEKLIDFAYENGVSNIHFLWLFKKGRADDSHDSLFVPPQDIFPYLVAAQEKGESKGIKIDNVEIIRSQVFSCPGTKYDLSNAGWQSIAIGPDGTIYPTPALIFNRDMACGQINRGLETAWKTSPVLREIREASLIHDHRYNGSAFKFLVGGGDIDHSIISSGKTVGGDPYLELYNNIAAWLIAREARNYQTNRYPSFQLKMGELLGECPLEGTEIFYTHSNCVLSLPGHDTHSLVNAFYSEAAKNPNEDILNPVCYPEELISHIPEELRFRSYGCGSPVVEANIQPGETVVDLGSGTGIECFIASRLAGSHGNVFGIDMGDDMLTIANHSKQKIKKHANVDNVAFKKAFLEELPLDDNSVDVVISNCVINLSPNKRRVFGEILRILKPGGRLVISDITYDENIPLTIKYNEKLRGECIGGALHYHDLFGLLDDLGFADSRTLRAFLYRTVKEYDFYSITYEAFKPDGKREAKIISRPPFKEVLTRVDSTPICTCFVKPEETVKEEIKIKDTIHISGCMVCGADLEYFESEIDRECFYCGLTKKANAVCCNEHFVCDQCHSADAVEIIKQVCLNTDEDDMIAIMKKIRSHHLFRVHGPEHHSLVPAVILTAYGNSGGNISKEQILKGINRGGSVPGGSCAFLGACGAAVGVGIGFSVILEATPLQGKERQLVQQVVQRVLGTIAEYDAPRCCQRDCWLALKQASDLSYEILNKKIKAEEDLTCNQFSKNKECIFNQCPLWPNITN